MPSHGALHTQILVLASLNHPNIAAIYGVEEGARIMELVEGATLTERIAAGTIPL
jgi:serine/threonine-protein kinase